MTDVGVEAPPQAPGLDRRRVRSALGLGLGLVGTRANIAVSGLLLTLLVSSRVSSAVAITFALGANRLVGWAAYPLLGRASDRSRGPAGRRAPFMAASLLVMGVGTYAYPSVPGYWGLVMAIVCVKIAYVVSGIGGLTVIPETFGKSRSVKALTLLAVLAAAVSLGIKGTVLATWRTDAPSTWAPAFHVAGVIMIVSAVLVLALVRESGAARAVADRERLLPVVSWRRELSQVLDTRNARLLATSVVLFWAGLSATGYLAFVYFEKVQHAGAATQTVAGWAAGAPSVIVGVLGGYGLSRALTRKQVAVLTPAAGTIVSLLQFESSHIWQTVALAIVGGPLFCAFVISLAPMLLELLPRSGGAAELLGKLLAPFSAVGLVFAFVAAWAVDASGDYRVIWLFPAAGGVAQAAVLCWLQLSDEERRPRLAGMGGRTVDWAVAQFENRGQRLFGGTLTEADADASSLFETARHLFEPRPGLATGDAGDAAAPDEAHDSAGSRLVDGPDDA